MKRNKQPRLEFFIRKFNGNYLRICVILLMMQLNITNVQSQPMPWEKDVWYQVNIGFDKCNNTIPSSTTTAADWNDGFTVTDLLHRRGKMYAWIKYASGCNQGMFEYDSTLNKWTRVTGLVDGSEPAKLLTNQKDIFALKNYGRIYIYDPSYSPTYWRQITTSNTKWITVPNCTSGGDVNWGDLFYIQLVGDYMYGLLLKNAKGNPQAQIVKWNLYGGEPITVDLVGNLPSDGTPETGGATYNTGGSSKIRFMVVEPIAGYFKYFISYQDFGNNQTYPYYVWVYDPRVGQLKWRNISGGINWMNTTGSSNPPSVPWGPCGHVHRNWKNDRIYATSEMGIWEWVGEGWIYRGENRMNITPYATSPAIFATGRNEVLYMKDAIFGRLGTELWEDDNFYRDCVHDKIEKLCSPDDGRSLYCVKVENGDGSCDWSGQNQVGIYRITVNHDKPLGVLNFHYEYATYVGGNSNYNTNDNTPVGVGANYNIFVAGNFDGTTGTWQTTNSYNGATNNSPAKIFVLGSDGQTKIRRVNLGTLMYDYEMMNYGDFKMVVSGNFGVSLIAPDGTQRRNLPSASIPGTNGQRIDVDINDHGDVVVMRYNTSTSKFDIRLFDSSFNAVTSVYSLGKQYCKDIAVDNSRNVFLVGFDQLTNGGYVRESCGQSGGHSDPVQNTYIWKMRVNSGALVFVDKLYSFASNVLDLDMADTRGYRINIGRNNKLYFAGEAAGGNSVFRWDGKKTIENNGCSNPPSKLVITDPYNNPYNTASAHITFIAEIDPSTFSIVKGQYLIPRLTDGKSNAHRVENGYIHADMAGEVYVSATSAAYTPGRKMLNVNGNRIGNYTQYDGVLAIIAGDFQNRIWWGTFNNTPTNAEVKATSCRGDVCALVATTFTGSFITTGANQIRSTPFFSGDVNKNDCYVGIWGRELSESANDDPMEDTVFTDPINVPPIIDDTEMNFSVDFTSNKTKVCSGQSVIFSNQTTSPPSGATYSWEFTGGSPATATGSANKTVTYTYDPADYLKTVKLTVSGSGKSSFELKPYFIQVLPSPLPNLPAITGTSTPDCEASYTVPVSTEYEWSVDSFVWTVPNNAVIVSGKYSKTILVRFGMGATGTVSCKAYYACGSTPAVSKNITSVSNGSPIMPGIISGNITPSLYANENYSISSMGTVTYHWRVEPSWAGFITGSSNNISIQWMDEGTFTVYVKAENSCGMGPERALSVTVSNCISPSISTHPSNRTICSGSNTTFSVTSSGVGLSYQWQLSSNGGSTWANQANGGVYSGMTTATMTITGSIPGMNSYQYRCIVSNACGTATSNAGILTVNTAPAIASHPSNRTICAGNNTTYSVTATGAGLSYQWQLSTN